MPRLHTVSRDALVDMLIACRECRLTLISAPAGSGKTTLLSGWAASEDEDRPFAWLSLEAADNDPVRFWGLVLEALRTVDGHVGAAADAALRAPGTSLLDYVVPLLVNELTEWGTPVVLVLDDYHVIHDEEIHESLAWLLSHLPHGPHVAMATRSDPPLPLPRLRVRREMTEIRAADLRLSDEEATAMLNEGLGLDLDGHEVAQLQTRTEGWAAGLQLAGLSLRGRADRGAFIALFAGDDRQITDYLGSEVLDAQPAPLRRFMLRTSVLDRLCGPLCDAVTGGGDGLEALARLERENLFVIPLDSRRRWYRFHHLFAELLRQRLEYEEPDAVPELHRRAAAWYTDSSSPEDAIHHSLAGGDLETAGELIARHWNESFNRGRLATVAGWLETLPEQRLRSDSRLWLARVWTAMDRGRLEEIEPWLEASPEEASADARAGETGEREAWAALLKGLHRFKVGDLVGARRCADRVGQMKTGPTPFWRTVARVLEGLTRFWTGEREAAVAAFEAALELARAEGNGLASVYSLGYLALLELELGRRAAAGRRMEEVDWLRDREPQLDEHFTALLARVAAGRSLQLDGQTDEAAAALDRAIELARRGAGVMELGYALLERARLARAGGDPVAGRELLDEVEAIVAERSDVGRLAHLLSEAGRVRGARKAPFDRDELSEREVAVLRLLPSELSLREIGGELYVSLNTVKTQARSIYLKLGVSSREDAVARARELGLL